MRLIPLFLALVVACCFSSSARAQLQADQLMLIVNKNVPDGMKLAQFYAEQRHVPDGRIIELDLPTGDSISFDAYERTVVPAIRNVIRNQKLEQQIRCLVTFYGVPLRVEARSNSPEDVKELKALQFEQADVLKQLSATVGELEGVVKSVVPTFEPQANATSQPNSNAPPGVALERLVARFGGAMNELGRQKPESVVPIDDKLRASLLKLLGPAQVPYKPGPGASTAPADVQQAHFAQRDATIKLLTGARVLEELRYDADARTKLRKLVRDNLGLLASARLIGQQIDYFQTSVPTSQVPLTTSAALDSELSFLWIPTYPRLGWVANPYHYAAPRGPKPPVLMVMRLDASKPDVVQKMIETSIKVEQTGLAGTFAIDARGFQADAPKPEAPPLVDYDNKTRELALLAKIKGTLPVVFDDRPELLAKDGQKDIALYTGWYSVHQYVSPGSFVPGAVGYHTASFELLSLHGANETGWVRGLTDAGVVASLGPVAEPYLHAFPRPDDFFPVLMTGKLTLAETYWSTTPLCSWMMSAVGDPLYRPFGVKPTIKVGDLPDRLKGIFETKQ